mgnify:CR=1 FL=1
MFHLSYVAKAAPALFGELMVVHLVASNADGAKQVSLMVENLASADMHGGRSSPSSSRRKVLVGGCFGDEGDVRPVFSGGDEQLCSVLVFARNAVYGRGQRFAVGIHHDDHHGAAEFRRFCHVVYDISRFHDRKLIFMFCFQAVSFPGKTVFHNIIILLGSQYFLVEVY